MFSGATSQNSISSSDSRSGRSSTRVQRPTALSTGGAESPAPSSRNRPSDPVVAPSTNHRMDLASLQKELESKSGILTFGSEIIAAQMGDFINEGLLGSGSCSSVYRMRHATRPDLVMAVKQMRRSSTCHEENKRILMDLKVVTLSNDCPFIVDCFGIFFSANDVWICMEVMPTCLDKLLYDLQRPFPERIIGKVTVSITTALNYLVKKHNMMHRDVKPSNMLVGFDGIIKLCDFGISGALKDSMAHSRQLGCVGYMAPERLETFTYDVRADIWSLGISLFELATGSFPYKGAELEFAVMSKIVSEPPPTLPDHLPFSTEFRSFIDLCLKKDYLERPKYRSLMKTEFFCRHDQPPIDIKDWLKNRPLSHLIQPKTEQFDQSAVVSSPGSSSTLSPDVVRNIRDLSLDGSFEMENTCPQSVDSSFPNDYPGLNNIQPLRQNSTAPKLTQMDLIDVSISSGSTASQRRDPFSLTSSGYGSVASDDSPNSLSAVNRPSRLCPPGTKLYSTDSKRAVQKALNKLANGHPARYPPTKYPPSDAAPSIPVRDNSLGRRRNKSIVFGSSEALNRFDYAPTNVCSMKSENSSRLPRVLQPAKDTDSPEEITFKKNSGKSDVIPPPVPPHLNRVRRKVVTDRESTRSPSYTPDPKSVRPMVHDSRTSQTNSIRMPLRLPTYPIPKPPSALNATDTPTQKMDPLRCRNSRPNALPGHHRLVTKVHRSKYLRASSQPPVLRSSLLKWPVYETDL